MYVTSNLERGEKTYPVKAYIFQNLNKKYKFVFSIYTATNIFTHIVYSSIVEVVGYS